ITLTPDASFSVSITVNGTTGPVSGALVELRIRAAADPLICWESGQGHPSITGITNGSGVATFNIGGGGCVDPQRFGQAAVDVFADGVKLAEVGVNSPDVVNSMGELPTAQNYVQDPLCIVGLADAVFHTDGIVAGNFEYCSNFTAPFDDAVSLGDAIILTSYIVGGGGGVAPPGTNSLDKVKLAIHLQSVAVKGVCAAAPTSLGCSSLGGSQLVTGGVSNQAYHAYIAALDVDPAQGLGGAAFSLTSSNSGSLFIGSWTNCGDLDFPSATWPQIGGENLITVSAGTNCFNTPDITDPEGEAIAVLGALYVYAYGPTDLSLGQRQTALPSIDISDCTAQQAEVPLGPRIGIVAFDGPGYEPCVPLPNFGSVFVQKAGSGSGLVTSVNPGINCGLDCGETYLLGTDVSLQASPDVGSVFTGWSDGCTGLGVCDFAVSGDTTVTANFDLVENARQLTVTKSGTGGGTVVGVSSGINCGSSCSGWYPTSTAISLTATPDPGSVFSGWSTGPCSGNGNCVFPLDNDTTVNAVFDLLADNSVNSIAEAAVKVDSLVAAGAHPTEAISFVVWPAAAESLLGPGTVVTDLDSSFAHTSIYGEYFFFVDQTPEEEWYHPATYVFVDSLTGGLTTYESTSPPIINDLVFQDYFELTGGFAEEAGINTGSNKDVVNVPAPTLIDGNNSKCALVVVGRNLSKSTTLIEGERKARENDVQRVLGYLNTNPKGPRVDKDHVTVLSGANYMGATAASVRQAIKDLKTNNPNCKEFYYYYMGHGRNPEADGNCEGGNGGKAGVILYKDPSTGPNDPGSGRDVFSHEELAIALAKNKCVTNRVTIEACFSGSAFPFFQDKKVKGTIVASSSGDVKTLRCNNVGVPFNMALTQCALDPAGDLNQNSKVTLIEAVGWANFLDPLVSGRCPQSVILGDERFTAFIPPEKAYKQKKRGATKAKKYRIYKDRKVTGNVAFKLCIQKYCQAIVPINPTFEPGFVWPWKSYRAEKKKKLDCKRILILENPNSGTSYIGQIQKGYSPNPIQNGSAEVVCVSKSGAETVIKPIVELVDLKFEPKESKAIAFLPEDCDRVYVRTKGDNSKGGVLPLADLSPSAGSLQNRSATYERDERVFQTVEVGGTPGESFSVSLQQPAGWDFIADPSVFTLSAIIDTEYVAVEGSVPDTVTQGGVVTITTINSALGDTIEVNVSVIVRDSLASSIASGDRLCLLSAESYGGFSVTSGSAEIIGSRVDFRVPTNALVDSSGALSLSQSSLRSTVNQPFSLDVRGSIDWSKVMVIDPQNGVILDGANGVVHGGGIQGSSGDGLTLRGNLANLFVSSIAVDSSGANGIVLDGVSNLLLDQVAVSASGLNDVSLVGGSTVTMQDCPFDETQLSVGVGSEITRTWTTVFEATTHESESISGVDLEVRDVFGSLVFRDTTSTAGFVSGRKLIEFIETDVGRVSYTPYAVRARWLDVDTTFSYTAASTELVTLVISDSTTVSIGDPETPPAV
ncbi:MAG: hypothetical protein HKN21_10915, partial [Candidatus Eisenbacteria bacterium]|nr:hypothetical protein [Candidatus Eisenbacteria bacterium]